jgi:hypothetical protein
MSRQPLTWRNINAPNYGSSNALLKDATDGINTSLGNAADNLTSLLSRDVNQQKANWDQTKADNTLGLQNRINSFNDLAGYDAFKQNIMGELAGMGKQVDSANIINLLNGRDDTLRADINAEQTFKDGQLTRQEAPQIAKINAAINAGKFDEARNLMDTANIRDKSGLEQSLRDTQIKYENKRQNDLIATLTHDTAVGAKSATEAVAALRKGLKENGITDKTLVSEALQNIRTTYENYSALDEHQQRRLAEEQILVDNQLATAASDRSNTLAGLPKLTEERSRELLDPTLLSRENMLKDIRSKQDTNSLWTFMGIFDNDTADLDNIALSVEEDYLRENVRLSRQAEQAKAQNNGEVPEELKAKLTASNELQEIMKLTKGQIPGLVIRDAYNEIAQRDGDYSKDEFRKALKRHLVMYANDRNALSKINAANSAYNNLVTSINGFNQINQADLTAMMRRKNRENAK